MEARRKSASRAASGKPFEFSINLLDEMTILVLGATGATGKHLTRYLLDRGHFVKAIVRSSLRLDNDLSDHPCLSVIEANVLDLSESELEEIVAGCSAIASCLGHTMSFRGVYGPPRRLVTDVAKRMCLAIRSIGHAVPIKYVLMNTTGNSNRDLDETISLAQKCVIGLLRLILPPHVDNEAAADFLRTDLGPKNEKIEWAVVRPDTLFDHDNASAFELHPSPTRSAIFDPGKTSRINVGQFMGQLIEDEELWSEWKGRMPVIYNSDS